MKIIAFTGMPFSGKSEAVKIAKNKGYIVIRMGDMVWEEVKKQGLELTDENVGIIANVMRKKYGKEIWAKKTIERIKNFSNVDCIVIDGIRNIEEIDAFKQNIGKKFILIAIDVSDEIRYKRGLNRNRLDDSKNLEKIKERDLRELNWGLNLSITAADILVVNEGTLKEYKDKISKLLNEI
jgi:dephospho-CoA kinase